MGGWEPQDSYALIEELIAVNQTELFTRMGQYVVTVLVPPMNPPPEVIQWGSRYFMRNALGRYCEGLVWVADVNPDVEIPADRAGHQNGVAG